MGRDRAKARGTIEGYVLDGQYPSNLHREFAPNWIDAMLRHKGVAPPRAPGAPFALMDLGCGDGLGLVLMAAAHPEGQFQGIEAQPGLTEGAAKIARECGIGNVGFRSLRFADLADPAEPGFDYVTAQGVMSWVDAENQAHVRRIAALHVRPCGVACLGYNTLPGWKDALAFQQMVRQFADAETGDAVARFDAALARIRAMSKAGAPAFSRAFMAWIDNLRATLPAGYFPHEYLNRHWTCFWAAEMIEAMAGAGFVLAAPGRAEQLREDYALKKAQRRQLAAIADPLARATAADIFTNACYRVDIYARALRPLDESRASRLDGWWAATVAAADAVYECRTPAGRLVFDNGAARAVLAGLEAGPATLHAIARNFAGTAQEVLDAADALLVAGHILPAGPPADTPGAAALNGLIRASAGAPGAIDALAGAHGPMPVAPRDMGDAATLRRLGIGD
ncbi:MAG TPA: class I SAM-dependent methyltransferase [Allosphingosinicella sp.]|nr:class I SAM-dependent methyltransferase [Allosphingosinicella sp.]